jgi:hypothetical protein
MHVYDIEGDVLYVRVLWVPKETSKVMMPTGSILLPPKL